jgi:1,4-dihydroxy-2-naphthoyl-CoA hydrolase
MEYSWSITFSIVEQTDDRVVGEMSVNQDIKNHYGNVHVGAILWLADTCATCLLFGPQPMYEGQKGFPLAINLTANFASNQSKGMLRAVATYVKRGKTISIVRTMVYGEGDKLIADVTTNHIMSK